MLLKSIRVPLIAWLLVAQTFNVYAANGHTATNGDGRILDAIEAEQADATALTAEAEIFKSIGMGLSLSIAQCEAMDNCSSIINPGELQSLLNTLDKRINGLILRQEQEGKDFTELLAIYVDRREDYLKYQQQLEQFVSSEPESTSLTADSAGEQIDFSIFEDADESLEELTGEAGLLEDDFNPAGSEQ